jgi:hypothetical protein
MGEEERKRAIIANFNKGYSRFCSAKGVSQKLRPLLSLIYNQIHEFPVNLSILKESLVALTSFLSQPEHCTDENCKAVDLFFTAGDHWDARWGSLPEEYQLILDDIGGCLHDNVSAPKIAENFESTPKQLLERVKKLKV